jgi:hypothetical protein
MRQYYVIDTTSLISYYPEIFKQEVKIKQEYLELIKHAFFPSSPIRIIVPSIVFIEIFEKWSVNEENSRCIYSAALWKYSNATLRPQIAKLSQAKREKLISQLDALRQVNSPQQLFKGISDLGHELKFATLGERKFVVNLVDNPASMNTLIPLMPSTTLNAGPVKLRVAVNDTVNLAVAISNLTRRLEEYRVFVFYDTDNGTELFGLAGAQGLFPRANIHCLRAVRVKDSEGKNPNQRFDPLPAMDQTYTVYAGAKDTALAWLQFDTSDVTPGIYRGRIRVIPLSQPAKMDKKGGIWHLAGEVLDIPLSVEVLPFELPREPKRPFFVWRDPLNENFFKRMVEQGIRFFQISPWYFDFKFNSDGTVDSFDGTRAEKAILKVLQWADKYKLRSEVNFAVVYSARQAFNYFARRDKFLFGSPHWLQAWKSYMSGIAAVFKKCGVSSSSYIVEIQDEPKACGISEEELLKYCRNAKEAAPDTVLMITADSKFKADDFTRLYPYIDVWCMWSNLLLRPSMQKLIKEFRTAGKRIWLYSCNVGISSDLYRYYRSHAWLGELCDVEVISMYQYIPGPHGDYGATLWKILSQGALAYRSFEHCISSIRNECLRQGVNDLRYFKLLEQLTRQAERQKKFPEVTVQARKLLKEAPKQVIRLNYDTSLADKYRNQAIDLILKLRK